MEASLALFEKIIEAYLKYSSYDPNCWTKAYFNNASGGFNVYHKDHRFSKIEGGGDAEKMVGYLLAQYNAKQVEFLPEGGKKSPDFQFDDQTWDVKFIEKANEETIRKCIRDARKADNAIFYFENANKLQELHSAVNREVSKFQKKDELYKIPNIYYMDNEFLRSLWHK
jgi:hypothetical protein